MAKLPADKLQPGTHRLLMRAVDQVGNVGEYTAATVRIVPVSLEQAGGYGEIKGTVLYNKRPWADAELKLKPATGPAPRPVTSDAQGSFSFRRVPAGKYKLSARAVVHNRPRMADADVELSVPPKPVPPLELQLR